MKFSLVIFLAFSLSSVNGWETDFESAKKKAEKEHKLILLNFSGSDWCIPCIRFRKEVFESVYFKDFSDSNLILVNADFPRLKKNELSKDQQKKNEKLADRYNPEGIFPYTLLLNAEGKVIISWKGFPDLTAGQFAAQLKMYTDARN